MHEPNQILDEIYRLSRNERNGTLILGSEKKHIELHFKNGKIDAASTDLPEFQIGRYLSKNDLLKGLRIADLLKESRKKALQLGETAVKRKLITDSELAEIIRVQILDLIMHSLTSSYEIRDFKATIPQLYLQAGFSSQELLLELARRNVNTFEPSPTQKLAVINGHGFADVSWYPQELSVISGLKTPKTIQELEASTGMEKDRLGKILSVLNTLHMITTTENVTSESKQESSPKDQLKEYLQDQTQKKEPDKSLESIVPEISTGGLSGKLDVLHNPASFISEQFKTLKVHLHKFSSERPAKVITVSSPYTSDGKSLVCVNLGLCFARDPNRRVLLIDCDLRNPTIHRYLGISLSPGLNGYLSENQIEPPCFMRRMGRLFIMTAGGTSTDPIELLSLDKMRDLIEGLKGDFDTILIDTPPLGLVSDANIMTDLSDGLIMVVRSNKTSYTNIERSFKTLDQSKLLGIVLNDVQPRMFNTQYDYRYYHYSNRNVYPYGPKMKKKFSNKTYFE